MYWICGYLLIFQFGRPLAVRDVFLLLVTKTSVGGCWFVNGEVLFDLLGCTFIHSSLFDGGAVDCSFATRLIFIGGTIGFWGTGNAQQLSFGTRRLKWFVTGLKS